MRAIPIGMHLQCKLFFLLTEKTDNTEWTETRICYLITGDPSSLYEPHKEHNMASNYKGLYGIFYKKSMKVIKSENTGLAGNLNSKVASLC